MMETYAERLQKYDEYRKEQMTNYSVDERERNERDEKLKQEEYNKDYVGYVAVDLELPDDIILKLSLQAHDRDITLNKMINIALKDSLKHLEHRFEHDNKQLLKEY